jgi:signal transduction histidine kinase/ActR/RegA family two-component response regulator
MINIKNLVFYYGFTSEQYYSVESLIDRDNFSNIRGLSVLMSILLLFHSLTTVIIHHYDFDHLLTFSIFFVCSLFLIFLLFKSKEKYYVMLTRIILVVMYAYGIVIGTFDAVDISAVTIVVFLVLLPSLCANRPIQTYVLEFCALIVFLVLIFKYETGNILRNDIVNSLSFTFVGILFHYMLARKSIKGNLYQIANIRSVKDLKAAKEKAEAAADAKESFLANMSHDIRTPLNAVLGLTQLALTKTDDSISLDYFRKINNSGNYLLGVLNDILDMSKIQSGKVSISLENVNFNEMIDEILEIIRPKAKQKQIEIKVTIDEQVSKYQKIDKVHVMQVLVNLLSNAVKYTNPSGLVSFTAEPFVTETGTSFVKYIIADNGIGMSADFMTHLYEVFKRENNIFSSSEGGTGLGLSIAKKLVDFMDGTIFCTSELELGTIFVVELPLKKISETEYKNEGFETVLVNQELNLKKGNLKILLVEDNPINSEIVIQLLNTKGFSVTHCENGLQAVDYIADNDNSEMFLILMDTQMPIMNGLEATKAIRKLPSLYAKKIPIIGLSANAFAEDRQKAKGVGMNDYLTKPVVANDLFKCIAQFI